MLAVDVGYPVTALFHRLPEQTARACVHHVLPVYAPEILLAVLGVPATVQQVQIIIDKNEKLSFP